MVTATAVIAMAAMAVVAVPPDAVGAETLPLRVTPASGAWFTDVSIAGTGCTAAPGTDLMVAGALHRAGADPNVQFGRFAANPAADGSWSVAVVVTHSGGDAMGTPTPATPGAYEFRATCGPVVDPIGSGPRPGEPAVATYAAPFEILPGGPTPVMSVAASTVAITDGRAPVTASGDLCRRPDGASTGMAVLDGPEGVNGEDPAVSYHASYFFTASSDGRWSGTLEPWEGSTPKPGVYELRGECWLGTAGQQSGNGFGYGPMTITLVAGTQPTPPPTPPQAAGHTRARHPDVHRLSGPLCALVPGSGRLPREELLGSQPSRSPDIR
jgi:hypothetical protein